MLNGDIIWKAHICCVSFSYSKQLWHQRWSWYIKIVHVNDLLWDLIVLWENTWKYLMYNLQQGQWGEAEQRRKSQSAEIVLWEAIKRRKKKQRTGHIWWADPGPVILSKLLSMALSSTVGNVFKLCSPVMQSKIRTSCSHPRSQNSLSFLVLLQSELKSCSDDDMKEQTLWGRLVVITVETLSPQQHMRKSSQRHGITARKEGGRCSRQRIVSRSSYNSTSWP